MLTAKQEQFRIKSIQIDTKDKLFALPHNNVSDWSKGRRPNENRICLLLHFETQYSVDIH